MELLSQIHKKYARLTNLLIEKNFTISTMESCTAGLVASLITDTQGASSIFAGAIVSYSNEIKEQAGISARIIERYGVYSLRMAEEMAKNCKKRLKTDISIGITGTFGNVDVNNSDSEEGQVYFAIAYKDNVQVFHISLNEQKSRFNYKLKVAEAIEEKLMEILNSEMN